jgi:hypothetical protein
MVTKDQVSIAFGDERKAFQVPNIDHDFKAISLLRERIPYDVCKSIIGGASHDVIYLCDLDEAMSYISEEDLNVLADCNVWVSDNGCLALFV